MAKVKSKRGIKIFIGVLAAVVVVLVCTTFWVAKHYVYNSVVGERAMVYVHGQWSAAQLDSALSEVLDAPRSVARVERLLSLLDFDAAEREGSYRVEPGISAWQVALKLARGGQTPVRVTFNNVRTIDQLAGRIAEQLCSMSVTAAALALWAGSDPGRACQAVVLGSGTGACLALFCLGLLLPRYRGAAAPRAGVPDACCASPYRWHWPTT